MELFRELNRDEYFYLPGKVLHIDADKEYLDRCMKFYKNMNVLSYGIVMKEKDVSSNIERYLIAKNMMIMQIIIIIKIVLIL